MTRAPSPRTDYTGPAHIPFDRTIHRMWGDSETGKVPDWIYVSGEKIHQLIFKLAPGDTFQHSANYRTYFAADVVYTILHGALVLINPETGEAHRAEAGQTVFFRRDTWHHGYNDSPQVLEVLEYLAPPPMQGTTSKYSNVLPLLEKTKYGQDHLMGKWPMERAQAKNESTIHVMNDADALLRVDDLQARVSSRIVVSTEHLTVGKMRLLPGQQGPVHTHGGDEGLFVQQGELLLRFPDADAQGWFELKQTDGFYIPEGLAHQYVNLSDAPVDLVFGVSPRFLP